jgi:iron complex outermembrane receptor protein
MRKLLATTSSLLVLGLVTGAPAWAQTHSDGNREDADVIVVTSQPLGVTADEVVGGVEVVDRRHLEDNLSGSLAAGPK